MTSQSLAKALNAAYISILGNAALAIIKGITGIYGDSYALIADAIESTSDIFSSFLILIGLKYAYKPADEDHPYGHGKAEALFTFVVVGFLVASASIITYESIENIRTPHALPKPYTLVVLFGIVVVKEFFFRFMQKRSDELGSTALKADAWHHRSDALTSLAAFIGIAVAIILGPGYEAADDWAALLAAAIIFYNSFLIFRPALGEIMDENAHPLLISDIKRIAGTVEGVIDTEKCFVRKMGTKYYVDLHAIVKHSITVREGHVISHKIKDKIIESLPQVADVLIHIEPDEE